MKRRTSAIGQGLTMLALAGVAATGCASESRVGNDPSQWTLPPMDTSAPFRMTVERLLELADGVPVSPPLTGWSEQTIERLAHEQAALYIAGVLDGDEQQRWCVAQSGVPPHEVDLMLLRRLRSAAGSDNAARALAAAAGDEFPCAK